MATQTTVYNAATGVCILDGVSDSEFDRWYDHHSEYRQVRDSSEVSPAFRDLYEAISDRPGVYWLVQD
jgi:hypothetical protein